MVMIGEGALAVTCGRGWEEEGVLYIERGAGLDGGLDEGTTIAGRGGWGGGLDAAGAGGWDDSPSGERFAGGACGAGSVDL
jgi:hypothetical protein